MPGKGSGRVSEFHTTRRVEFADTDVSGLIHFGRYFIYMETTEHLFLESLGTSVHVTEDGREIGWPRVSATCDYLSPVGFADVVEIRLRVERKGTKSITYGYLFTCGERKVARGRITAVCCVLNGEDGLEAVPIPPAIADHIEEFSDDG